MHIYMSLAFHVFLLFSIFANHFIQPKLRDTSSLLCSQSFN